MDAAIVWTIAGTGAAVIATGITLVGFIYTFLRNFKTDINGKIDKLDSDIKADMRVQTARTDQLYQMFNAHMDQANARMDQMHKMFYDLLKSQTPKTNP